MKLKTTLKLSFLAHEIAIYAHCMKDVGMTFVKKRNIITVAKAIRKNAKDFTRILSTECTAQTKKTFGITSKTLMNICKTPQQLNFIANETLHWMKRYDRAIAIASKKRDALKKGVPVQMEFNFNG